MIARRLALEFDLRIGLAGDSALEPNLPFIGRAGDLHKVADSRAGGAHRAGLVLAQPRQPEAHLFHHGVLDFVAESQTGQRLAFAHGDLLQRLHRHPWFERLDGDRQLVIRLEQPERDHTGTRLAGLLRIELRHILPCHRAQPDAPLRDEEHLPALPGRFANQDLGNIPLRLRMRRGAGQRQRKGLGANGAAGQVHGDDAFSRFVGFSPLAQCRAAQRLDIEPIRQREAEAENPGARDLDVQIHRQHQPVVSQRQRLPGGHPHLGGDRRHLQRDAPPIAAIAKDAAAARPAAARSGSAG